MKKGDAQNLPKGWEIKRLDEVCEFGNGLWTGKKPPFKSVGVIRNTNFTKDGKLDDSDIVYLDVEQSQFAKRKLQYGDIILEKSGGGPKQPVGRVIIFDKKKGDFSFSNFTSVIRIANPKTVDFTYLHRYLFFSYVSGATEAMQSHSTGIRNLKFDEYKALEIPLPPLPEQQRIVAILDEAFAAIAKAKANAEQNLKNAKELFESYLQGVFENKGEGWEEKTLGEVLVKTETVDPTKKPNEEFIYLDVSSVNKETKEIENVTVLLGKDAPSRARKLVRTNDVIFATVRPTHSRVALITEEYDEQVCSTGYFVLRAKEFLKNNLVYYFLLTYSFNKQMEKLQKGASYPAVTDSEVKGIYISFPKSLKEQQTIVQKLNALSAETKKVEAIYNQKINDLEELKKSVLQKAFSGALRCGEPAATKTAKQIAL
ncbi:MAG: restriction endonuclease subunit S [Bacteroidota bacterium]